MNVQVSKQFCMQHSFNYTIPADGFYDDFGESLRNDLEYILEKNDCDVDVTIVYDNGRGNSFLSYVCQYTPYDYIGKDIRRFIETKLGTHMKINVEVEIQKKSFCSLDDVPDSAWS
jgi:5S rRNA maturation endonuclease (ribonuclease M5)